MKFLFRYFISLSLLLLFAFSIIAQDKITFCTLLDEMVDLDRLTTISSKNYKALQFSSYDRRSTSPNTEGWFANSDGFGNPPIPGFEGVLKEPDEEGIGEYIICDVQSPGAILRLWTAGINGKVRVYIDDMSSPFFEGNAKDFFLNTPQAIMGTELPENLLKQFAAVYFPIPFSKRLRIEWRGKYKEEQFYHVGLKVYDDGVQVEPFSKEAFLACADKFYQVVERLNQKESWDDYETRLSENTLPAGESKILWESANMGAIESIYIRTEALDIENTLRKCILNIYFDNSPTPQIQAPLGDFFGAAPGINPFNSLAASVHKNGAMISRFIMPYKQNARIEVVNHTGEAINLFSGIKSKDYSWEDGKSMHFRARWRIKHGVTASNKSIIDYPYLIALGKGRLVGAAAYLYNPSNVPTSVGNWWGEGDEKIFVDGESFPSFFGTGSEDYYNYAHCSPWIFSYAYCGQPRNDGPGNRGYVANFRWHILDDIPFKQSIAFYMELYHHGVVPNFSYGSIVYYYAVPGTLDDYQQISMEDIRDLPYDPWTPEGYYFSEGYRFVNAENIVKRIPTAKVEEGKLWADGKILMWKPIKKGEQLRFTIISDESKERTHVGYTLAKMPDGGKYSVSVNGENVLVNRREIISLFQENQTILDNYFTEPIPLKKGKNEIVFKNEDEIPGKNIGIDFIWLRDIALP